MIAHAGFPRSLCGGAGMQMPAPPGLTTYLFTSPESRFPP